MSAARPALGRGLDALIQRAQSDLSGDRRGEPLELPLDAIRPNPEQPRTHIDPGALEELADSIRAVGLLQPLLVIPGRGGHYTLVAGERRWRAARRAGLTSVPVFVTSLAGDELLAAALVENLQREDLSPLEEARAYERLLQTTGGTQAEIARRVGKSRSAVANALRLLHLPDRIKDSLAAGEISEGHARAILGLADSAAQEELWRRVRDQGLSVRQTERAARALREPERPADPAPAPGSTSAADVAMAEELQSVLGTQVRLQRGRKGGWLSLRWYNDEQLRHLASRLAEAQAEPPPPSHLTI